MSDPPPGQSDPETDALFEEARRLRRRRWLIGSSLVAVAAIVSGTLVVAFWSGGSRVSSSPAKSAHTGLFASAGKVTPDQPIALAIAPSGDLYIGDRGRNEILEWMPSRRFRVVAGTGVAGLTGDGGPADRAEVNGPNNLVIASNGTLYFTQAGTYRAPSNSSGGMLNTVIREITSAGTIRTIAGLRPRCASGSIRSIPAETALFYGARLSLFPSGALAVDASVCVGETHDAGIGPNLLLTSSGLIVKEISNPVPAVASVACGDGVPGPGFHAFACESGGARAGHPHPKELLVVGDDGSFVAYPRYGGTDFAVGDGELVATYDGNLVRVTSSRLVPLLTNKELVSDLRIQSIADIGAPTVSAGGDVYFVASILGRPGCQNRILELASGGRLRRIWSSSASKHNTCF